MIDPERLAHYRAMPGNTAYYIIAEDYRAGLVTEEEAQAYADILFPPYWPATAEPLASGLSVIHWRVALVVAIAIVGNLAYALAELPPHGAKVLIGAGILGAVLIAALAGWHGLRRDPRAS